MFSLRDRGFFCIQNPLPTERLLKNPNFFIFFKFCEFPVQNFVFNNRGYKPYRPA